MWVSWLTLLMLIPTFYITQGELRKRSDGSSEFIDIKVKHNTEDFHLKCNVDLRDAEKVYWVRLDDPSIDVLLYTNANLNIELPDRTDLIIRDAVDDSEIRGKLFACYVEYKNGTKASGIPYKITITHKMHGLILQVVAHVEKNVVDMYRDELKWQGFTGSEADFRWKAHQNIRADVYYFYNRINAIYEEQFNMKVALNNLKILDSNVFIVGNKTENYYENRRYFQNLYGRKVPASAYIMYVRDQMYSSDASMRTISGTFYDCGACNGNYKYGIVRYYMDYSTVLVTAHELAHSIGIRHDFESDLPSKIQNPYYHPSSLSRWSFSARSKQFFAAVKRHHSMKWCLTTHYATDYYKPVYTEGEITANLADPDNYCSRLLRSKSYKCNIGENIRQNDAVCDQVQCYNPNLDVCNPRLTGAPDGMVCGHNKTCRFGKCVKSTDIRSSRVDDDCVFGDQSTVTFEWKGKIFKGTCAEFIEQNMKIMCKYKMVGYLCCKTCKALKTKIKGCEWGDEWRYCQSYVKGVICPYMRQFCCETCHGV